MREELVDTEYKDSVRQLARESMHMLEPICQECWDEGRDDPLGLRTGVNTKYNKNINKIVDAIIEETPDADHMWRTEIREELVEVFYDERRQQIQSSKRKVDNSLECYYCFLDRKESEGELSIRVKDVSAYDLLNKDQQDWQ